MAALRFVLNKRNCFQDAVLHRLLRAAKRCVCTLHPPRSRILQAVRRVGITLQVAWDSNTRMGDMLGLLTGSLNFEVLGYHWQGSRKKVHCADHVLQKVCPSRTPAASQPFGVWPYFQQSCCSVRASYVKSACMQSIWWRPRQPAMFV